MAQPQATTYTTVYTSGSVPPQPAPYTVVSQPVEITTVQQQTTFQDADRAACKKNGGFQILMGLLCLIFGTVSICIHTYYGDIATPFWTGCWFMIAGSCGARVGTYQGFMAAKSLQRYSSLSGVSIAFAITLLIIMSIAVAREPTYNYYGYSYASRIGIDATLLTISILELLAAMNGIGIAQKTLRGAQRNTTTTTRPAVATVPVAATGYPSAPMPNPYPPAYGAGQGYQPPPPQYGYPPQPAPPAQAGYGAMESKPPVY